jgi:hypothetical protein
LRHNGIRIEELTELSHHSLIQYLLPATGELIQLLQITVQNRPGTAPGISPELADVLSTIIGRIRGDDDQPDVPLVVSYDQNERVYNPPMLLLFQYRRRLGTRAVRRAGFGPGAARGIASGRSPHSPERTQPNEQPEQHRRAELSQAGGGNRHTPDNEDAIGPQLERRGSIRPWRPR